MARKVKNWSEMLEEIQFRRSFVYREGCKFVYDSGDLPDSLVSVAPGTVLALRRPHGITATQMPGKAEDWIVIGSGEGGSIPQIVDEDLDNVSTNAVQNKVIKEALDSKVSTVAQTYTDRQKENARTNIGAQENIVAMQNVQPIVAALNDRVAVSAEVEGVSKLRSMGYKVLKAPVTGDITTSFQRQLAPTVDGTAQPITNTVFEVKDYFDLGGGSFTMPTNSKLKIEGGKIDNGTLVLNNCQIEATDGWIGENLTISGKCTSIVYADWFCYTSDADKIERAIQLFANIHLYPRQYNIDRPIVIANNFSIIGESIGDFFSTGYGNSISARRTILKASDSADSHIDCIICVQGSKAPTADANYPIHSPKVTIAKADYLSASIENVSFTANRRSDGIWWSTPGGPSKPFNLSKCSFTTLRRGLDIHGSRPSTGSSATSTNIEQLYINQCVFTGNVWGMYVTGEHAIGGMIISATAMEQNHSDDYTTGGGIYSKKITATGSTTSGVPFFGTSIFDSVEFEGQPYGMVIVGDNMNIEMRGCYLERNDGQKNTFTGESYKYSRIHFSLDAAHSASGMEATFTDLFVDADRPFGKAALSKLIFRRCLVTENALLYNSQIYDASPSMIKVTNNLNIPKKKAFISFSSVFSSTTSWSTKVLYERLGAFSFVQLFKLSGTANDEVAGYTNKSIPVGNYMLLFYVVYNPSSNNGIAIRKKNKGASSYTAFKSIALLAQEKNVGITLVNVPIEVTTELDALDISFFARPNGGDMMFSRPVLVEDDGSSLFYDFELGVYQGNANGNPIDSFAGDRYTHYSTKKVLVFDRYCWRDTMGEFFINATGTLENRLTITKYVGEQYRETGNGSETYATPKDMVYKDSSWWNASNGTVVVDYTSDLDTASTNYTTAGIQVKLTDTDPFLLNKIFRRKSSEWTDTSDNKTATVPTPTIEITYDETEGVYIATISCASTSSAIYYSKDGSTPYKPADDETNPTSQLYTEPIVLSEDDKIQAIGVRNNLANSAIGFIPVATPEISFTSAGLLGITCSTEGAKIYYTIDGTTPDKNSTEYSTSTQVTIPVGTTVKAIAMLIGRIDSSVASKERS